MICNAIGDIPQTFRLYTASKSLGISGPSAILTATDACLAQSLGVFRINLSASVEAASYFQSLTSCEEPVRVAWGASA